VAAVLTRYFGRRKTMRWGRARLSVVLPISVIVAVAIVCIIVAALTSAQRADEVALDHERSLLAKSIANHGERVLRELESVVVSDQAVRSIRGKFDSVWIQQRIGLWLKTYFDHDFVFVADSSDHLVYALLGQNSVDPAWFNSVLPDLQPTFDYVRGRAGAQRAHAARIAESKSTSASTPLLRAALVQNFMQRPAIVAAALIVPLDAEAREEDRITAPMVLSVKFIDNEVLSDIGARLQLAQLRHVGDRPVEPEEYSYDILDDHGRPIVRFAWTPKRPGAEIVHSVIPFIAVALAGFALLAVLVFGYMRRSAAMIAAGEKRLRHLALHDPLCGLPNRNYFGERLENVIEEVRRGGGSAAVFYLDLDHFKDVNDTLGHHIGDELIRNVTARLRGALRNDDIVARLGGDEFAVLTSTASDHTTLQAIAARIISALCAPYSIGDHTIVIGASIGIAVIDSRAGDAADIMRYADMALYRAKNEGRNRACIYDAAMDADLSHRKLLEGDLREAIENNHLRLLYQPLVNASGEKTVGVEALARWNHPKRGEIPPMEFIPIAEHSGLIIALGEWVLRRACLDGKAWPGITVAVNVSPLQFRRGDFVDTVERILAETEFDPARLELELTESTLLGNVDSAESAMHRLKAAGVRLALDDFGTGYSSLAYLRRFPFDKLKIDRSFVRSIEKAADAAAIVHAIVSLGRGLGMKVTAEGVENAEQQLFLRAAGVHSMQGYRFGMPMTAEEITIRLAKPGTYRSIESDARAMAG
jgi:diguanylate cyclase (GGDEF)-like protein